MKWFLGRRIAAVAVLGLLYATVGFALNPVTAGACDEEGSITVKKAADDGDSFEFRLGEEPGQMVSAGDEHTWTGLHDGTYRLTELLSVDQVAAGWSLTGVTCDVPFEAIEGGVELVLGSDPAPLCEECEPVRDVICTFTNEKEEEPEYGSITVIKQTSPATNTEFSFTFDEGGNPVSFTLEGRDDPSTSGTIENRKLFAELSPKTYTISELTGTLPGGYAFMSVACTGGDDEVEYSGATVEIQLMEGSDYVCTFANEVPTRPTSPPTPTPRGAIGDFVWLDTDGNGIQDTGEPPLAGVTVQLLDSSGGTVLASKNTDTDGNYRFDGLDPATYRVRFALPDVFDEKVESFTRLSVGPFDKDSDADPAVGGLTALIHLDLGEVDLSWDAGIVSTGVLGIQVEPTTTTTTTTTTAVSPATLPFTGPGFDAGLAGLAAVAIAGLGGLMVGATVKRGRHERA